jgi:hypothetical protein
MQVTFRITTAFFHRTYGFIILLQINEYNKDQINSKFLGHGDILSIVLGNVRQFLIL